MATAAAPYKNWDAFITAANRQQGLCAGYNWQLDLVDGCKVELATFLAHVAFESNNYAEAFDETEAWFEGANAAMFQTTETDGCTSASYSDATCLQGPLMSTYTELTIFATKTSAVITDLTDEEFWMSGLFTFTFARSSPSLFAVATDSW